MRRRSLLFAGESTRKTGWIACREYNTMQLVLSLADEGETTQSLCSDPSTGCQSDLDWEQNSTLCYRSRDSSGPAYLSGLLSINLPALCVLQTLVSWLFHASNSTSMESVFSHAYDLWPWFPSPLFFSFKSSLKTSLFESSCTEDIHSPTQKGVWTKLIVYRVSSVSG